MSVMHPGGGQRKWLRHEDWEAAKTVIAAVDAKYGTTGATGGTRQDAIRHSTWNCVLAHRLGLNKTGMAATANEYTGKMDNAAISSNSVMDMNNNMRGALKGSVQINPILTLEQAMNLMEGLYDGGNSLKKWIPDNNTVENHHGMLRWSNGQKPFNN